MEPVDLEAKLFYSIEGNDVKAMKDAIKAGADVDTIYYGLDSCNRCSWAALHICCEKGRYECARLLLKAGACPDICDRYNETPLMYSVCTEWHNLMELLIQYGCRVNAANCRSHTAVHKAIRCSDTECLDILIKHGADINARNVLNRSPLWLAVSEDGRLACVKRLLEAGCEINRIDGKNHFTPLQAAIFYAKTDRLAYVKLLLAAGAHTHPSQPDPDEETALETAVRITNHRKRRGTISDDDHEVIVTLVEAGCDVSVLLSLITGDDVAMVELLLKAGANPDVQDEYCRTPLLVALDLGFHQMVIPLLQHNADLTLAGRNTDIKADLVTPFFTGLEGGNWSLAQLILHTGYNLSADTYLHADDGDDCASVYLTHHRDTWHWLLQLMSTPQPLLILCRSFIRRRLGVALYRKLMQLHLPQTLMDIIMLANLRVENI